MNMNTTAPELTEVPVRGGQSRSEMLQTCAGVAADQDVTVEYVFMGKCFAVKGTLRVDEASTARIGGLIVGMMTRWGLAPSGLVKAVFV